MIDTSNQAGALSAAERSYLTSKVRGRSWEDPMPEGDSQEELPHVRGQGHRPREPGCDGAGPAKRSYPASEARDDGREELYCNQGQGQQARGATPRLRPGVVTEARGGNPGGATPCLRPGPAAGRSNPVSKEWWLHGSRRA